MYTSTTETSCIFRQLPLTPNAIFQFKSVSTTKQLLKATVNYWKSGVSVERNNWKASEQLCLESLPIGIKCITTVTTVKATITFEQTKVTFWNHPISPTIVLQLLIYSLFQLHRCRKYKIKRWIFLQKPFKGWPVVSNEDTGKYGYVYTQGKNSNWNKYGILYWQCLHFWALGWW